MILTGTTKEDENCILLYFRLLSRKIVCQIHIFASMLKKRTAIVFLTLAYAILFGHDIIPHHHHPNLKELSEHHSTHQNHETDSEGISHLLSHIFHSAEGFTFSPLHAIAKTFSKQQPSFDVVLTGIFSFDTFPSLPFLYQLVAEHPSYISPHSYPCGLRAPPAIFILIAFFAESCHLFHC